MRRYWGLLALLASAGCAPPAERAAGPRPPFELARGRDGTAQFGRSFLRRREGVFEARFEGGPYERGYARGRLAYDQIVAGETDLDFLLRQMVPSALKRWIFRELLASTMRRSEKYIGREHLEEIAGLADAEVPDPFPAGWRAYARQLSLHALHDFSQRFIDTVPLSGACSGFAANGKVTADGHVCLARNFDFEAGTRFDREKIVAAVVPSRGNAYLSVTFGGLTGVVSGFNSRGLAVSLQSLSGGPTQSAGEPATLLAADVLESDGTVEEAIARLRSAKVLVSDIYLLADSQGHLAAVEKTPEAVGVRRAETILVATNVPRTPEVSAVLGPPPPVSTSEYRQRRLEELLSGYASGAKGGLTPASAAGILRDRSGTGGKELGPGNRNAIDALIACHSVVFDLTARRAYVAAFPHTLGRYAAFDLDLLSKAEPGDPRFADLSRESLREDPFLSSGAYARYREARRRLREARARMARKDPARALSKATEALALAPDFVEAYARRAAAEAALGRFEEAAADFEQALARDPGPPDFAAQILRSRRLAAERTRSPEGLAFPLSLEDLIEENRGR
jgi:isopenicillin-N N-acyltransferase-like protein